MRMLYFGGLRLIQVLGGCEYYECLRLRRGVNWGNTLYYVNCFTDGHWQLSTEYLFQIMLVSEP